MTSTCPTCAADPRLEGITSDVHDRLVTLFDAGTAAAAVELLDHFDLCSGEEPGQLWPQHARLFVGSHRREDQATAYRLAGWIEGIESARRSPQCHDQATLAKP